MTRMRTVGLTGRAEIRSLTEMTKGTRKKTYVPGVEIYAGRGAADG